MRGGGAVLRIISTIFLTTDTKIEYGNILGSHFQFCGGVT
jgi:hypothetical protein